MLEGIFHSSSLSDVSHLELPVTGRGKKLRQRADYDTVDSETAVVGDDGEV